MVIVPMHRNIIMLFCQVFSLITVSSHFVRMTLKKSKLDARTKIHFPSSVLIFSPGRTKKKEETIFSPFKIGKLISLRKSTSGYERLLSDVPYLGLDTRGLSSGCTHCEHDECKIQTN